MNAITPPTPENVADMLTGGDNDYHDGNDWTPSITADGSVVRISITPYTEDGAELDKVPFCAVVVEGDQAPIVLPRPAELGISWEPACPDRGVPGRSGDRQEARGRVRLAARLPHPGRAGTATCAEFSARLPKRFHDPD